MLLVNESIVFIPTEQLDFILKFKNNNCLKVNYLCFLYKF